MYDANDLTAERAEAFALAIRYISSASPRWCPYPYVVQTAHTILTTQGPSIVVKVSAGGQKNGGDFSPGADFHREIALRTIAEAIRFLLDLTETSKEEEVMIELGYASLGYDSPR